MSPARVGRYRLGEIIGAGGMGEVLHGHDEVLDRPVAIKLLRKELASDPGSLERFRREARIAASLSHPGIASVFDFVEEGDGRPLMVMELLVGRDLHTILSREGPLDPKTAGAVAAQVAEGLDHAHRAGAIHRDVKPGNIFLT
ncbi:MAG: serine/threonine-protein kinase, partial [Actinomycetota bacterium]